nr:hypothetical protein [Tanacetum cinerariifolium]
MFMYTTRDDTKLGNLKFVSKYEDVQVYGSLIPKEMTNAAMQEFKSFKTYYAIATGAAPLKVKRSAKVSPAKSKKKGPAKIDIGKGLTVLFEVALSEKAQLKKALDLASKTFMDLMLVAQELVQIKELVLYHSDDGDDDNEDNDDDDNNDNDKEQKEEKEEEEENTDDHVPTPKDMDLSDKEDDEEKEEKEEDDYEMLYRDLNVNPRTEDEDITNADQGGQEHNDSQDTRLLNIENVSPTKYTLALVLDAIVQQTTSLVITTILLPPSSIIPPTPQATPIHITQIAKDKELPRSFDELMSTPIDFLAFVMKMPKIENLTQETLDLLTFDLLKVTCKSFIKLEYHFKEVYKAMNDRLDWNKSKGQAYQFYLSKLLPLIQDARGRQVVLMNYFINNDLIFLQGGSSSIQYKTSTTKTKDALYDQIYGIEDMVPTMDSN